MAVCVDETTIAEQVQKIADPGGDYNGDGKQWADRFAAAPEEFRADKRFLLRTMEWGDRTFSNVFTKEGLAKWAYKACSEELRADKELLMKVLEMNPLGIYAAASESFRESEDVVHAVIDHKEGPCGWQSVNNPEWVGESLPEKFKGDKKVMMKLVSCNEAALDRTSNVNKNGEALRFASEAVRADKEVVMAALRGNGLCLKFAADTLKADKEVVMLAVDQEGNHEATLAFASAALQADMAMITAATGKRVAPVHAEERLPEGRYEAELVTGHEWPNGSFDSEIKVTADGQFLFAYNWGAMLSWSEYNETERDPHQLDGDLWRSFQTTVINRQKDLPGATTFEVENILGPFVYWKAEGTEATMKWTHLEDDAPECIEE